MPDLPLWSWTGPWATLYGLGNYIAGLGVSHIHRASGGGASISQRFSVVQVQPKSRLNQSLNFLHYNRVTRCVQASVVFRIFRRVVNLTVQFQDTAQKFHCTNLMQEWPLERRSCTLLNARNHFSRAFIIRGARGSTNYVEKAIDLMRKSQLYRVAVHRIPRSSSLSLSDLPARDRPPRPCAQRSLHIPKTPKKSPMKMAAVVAADAATADMT